jgi:DNA processing protein
MYDNVNMLKLESEDYPSGLRNITSPPEVLYWQGTNPKEWLDKPKVAIVGSRKMTAYGQAATAELAKGLSKAGVVIISGLAFGVDITAHRAALSVNGLTVAVIPTGLDNITPRSHYQIAKEIVKHGTIMTEQPFAKPVNLGLFVIRNRIISGLADIVLIPEAVLKSGSLHTARFALEQGKTVMAVPGNINSPASQGSNNLIKSGAVPVTSVDDVLFALKIDPAGRKPHRTSFGSRQERLVYELIQNGISQQDDIASAASLDITAISAALTMLEIAGHIRPAGVGNWLAA